MKKNCLILTILLLIVVGVYAGPFGLEQGMSYEEVKKACGGREPVKIGEDWYLITPIKQHSQFIEYYVRIDPSEGLYFIKAFGIDTFTNGNGTALKVQFREIEQSLCKTYGKVERTDWLIDGSIWDSDDDWMMSIKNKDRYYFSWWDKKRASLPETLDSVALGINVDSSYSGKLEIEYSFTNSNKVDLRQEEIEDSVL